MEKAIAAGMIDERKRRRDATGIIIVFALSGMLGLIVGIILPVPILSRGFFAVLFLAAKIWMICGGLYYVIWVPVMTWAARIVLVRRLKIEIYETYIMGVGVTGCQYYETKMRKIKNRKISEFKISYDKIVGVSLYQDRSGISIQTLSGDIECAVDNGQELRGLILERIG